MHKGRQICACTVCEGVWGTQARFEVCECPRLAVLALELAYLWQQTRLRGVSLIGAKHMENEGCSPVFHGSGRQGT